MTTSGRATRIACSSNFETTEFACNTYKSPNSAFSKVQLFFLAKRHQPLFLSSFLPRPFFDFPASQDEHNLSYVRSAGCSSKLGLDFSL